MSGYRLASVAQNISILDISDGNVQELYTYLPANKRSPLSCSWGHDGSSLVSVVPETQKLVMVYTKKNVFTATEISAVPNPQMAFMSRKKLSKVFVANPSKVFMYDIKLKKVASEFPLSANFRCFTGNYNDSFVAVGCKNGSIHLINTLTNHVSQPLCGSGSRAQQAGYEVSTLAYSQRSMLASGSEDGTVALWDCNANAKVKSFQEHLAPCTGVSFSPLNENLALSCGLDKRCVCYDSKAHKRLSTLKTEYPITAIDIFPNGQCVALGTSCGKILVYDLRSFTRPVATHKAHSSAITSISFQRRSASLNESKGIRLSNSKLTKMPISTVSLASAMKENVPTTTSPASLPYRDDNYSRMSKQKSRESICSQIISPIRGVDGSEATSPSPSTASGIINNSNISHDSIFSPLKEHSNNSGHNGSDSLVPRTPISSFNRSISTPLISPLAMISEEDLPNNADDPDSDSRPVLKIADINVENESKTEYDDVTSTSSASVTASKNVASVMSQSRIFQKPVTVTSLPSTIESFKRNDNIIASTPFVGSNEEQEKNNVQKNQNNLHTENLSKNTALTGSEMRAVFAAFPKAALEAEATSSIDLNVLNKEQNADLANDDGSDSSKFSKLTAFQQEYLRQCVEDAMDDFCLAMRQQMWHMQYNMIQMFQRQRDDFNCQLRSYAVNEELVKEIDRLRKENEELRKYF